MSEPKMHIDPRIIDQIIEAISDSTIVNWRPRNRQVKFHHFINDVHFTAHVWCFCGFRFFDALSVGARIVSLSRSQKRRIKKAMFQAHRNYLSERKLRIMKKAREINDRILQQ